MFSNWNGNIWTTAASSFKMKYCKIMRNDILLRNFIPCKSTTTVTNVDGDTVPADTKGLYDLVEGEFYTNKSGGKDFTAGPEV